MVLVYLYAAEEPKAFVGDLVEMGHGGLLALENHDDLAYGSPIDELSSVVVLNPLYDEEDSILVKVLRVIVAHHEAYLDQLE